MPNSPNPEGQERVVDGARWKTAVCPVHGFTIDRDHNLGSGRCTAPGCHNWHEVRDFAPLPDDAVCVVLDRRTAESLHADPFADTAAGITAARELRVAIHASLSTSGEGE